MRHYFDHNATTPVSPEAMEALDRAATRQFGNPSSIHAEGQAARNEIESARRSVARLLNCSPNEIVFTSGGTEADNLALLGPGASVVVISQIEHPAVLEAATECERSGAKAAAVAVSVDGVVDLDAVRQALESSPGKGVLSLMHANNETGAIQPLAEAAAIAREHGALVHSDGVQAAGKVEIDVKALGVDMYSISGHKFGAPKGIGALYVRDGIQLARRQFGGGHERGRRAGTENAPGIAALGAAAAWWVEHGQAERLRLAGLRDRLERSILDRIPGTRVNSASVCRTPNTSSISFHGVDAEAMLIALDLAGFAVSTGAACSSGAVKPSHVLTAMGLSRDEAKSTIRFSLGRTTAAEAVEALIDGVEAACARLRTVSTAYGR